MDAKVPEGAPLGQVPTMLRDLLAERFQLVTRIETREENVYVLTVAKNGPRLIKSELGVMPWPDSAPWWQTRLSLTQEQCRCRV